MHLVLNANVLFAAIIKDSATRKLLTNSHLTLYAPDLILLEKNRYRELLQSKQDLTFSQADEIESRLLSRVRVCVPTTKSLLKAQSFSPDPDDIPYLAVCLDLGCPLWSNDKRLKQQLIVRILSTQELLAALRT